MRLPALCLILALSAPPLAAHETPGAHPALHCAALAEIAGRMLEAAGEMTPEDRAALDEAVAIMLGHSGIAKGKRRAALAAQIEETAAHHTDAEIADEVDKKGDACLRDYVK